MAEGFLKKMLEDSDGPVKITVLSAGLNALGGPPTREARVVMEKRGIDISSLTSKQLTGEMIERANLILTMEEGYEGTVISWQPSSKQKVFTLKQFAGEVEDLNIKDPYRRGIEAYERCAKEIGLALAKGLKRIVDFVS